MGRSRHVGTTIALTATLLLALGTVGTAAQESPRDIGDACPTERVPDGDFWDVTGAHKPGVDCIVWWEITRGVSLVTYEPAGAVTRAQMASFVARAIDAAGGELPPAAGHHFDDTDGNVHEDNIDRLAEAGIVSGTGGGAYSPNRAVRRDQMATFLANAYEHLADAELPEGAGFADTEGNIHEQAIGKIAEAGFTGGTDPDTYSPARTVTRGQMGSFLARMLDKSVADLAAAPPTRSDPRLSGQGSDVLRGHIPGDAPAVAVLTHQGSSNFAIWAFDDAGEDYDLIVNDIGTYAGRTTVNFDRFGRTLAGLDITADGRWSIRLRPANAARQLATPDDAGHGDDVVRVHDYAGSDVRLTHQGDSNFAIWVYDRDTERIDLLVNEIGDHSGTHRMPRDAAWLEVRADGDWTVELR